MKQYKKYPGRLLQVRLSEEEYDEIIESIKKFKKTRRDFIIATIKEVKKYNIIRDGEFWESNQQYAYFHRDNYDKDIGLDTECEVCGKESDGSFNRHHHYGYDGDNAFKVNIVCKQCHGRLHADIYKNISFEESAEILRKFYKCKHPKYKLNDTKEYWKNEKVCEDCGGSITSMGLIKTK